MKKLFIGCALLLATASLSLTAQDNKGQTDTRKNAQTECCRQNCPRKDCDKKKCAECKECSSKDACKQQCQKGQDCKDCPRKAGCEACKAECQKKAQDCQKQCAGKQCKK